MSIEAPYMFIVYYTTGGFDDFTRVSIFVTENEKLAKSYVEKFNRILARWKAYWATIVNEGNWLDTNNYNFERWNQINDLSNAYYQKIQIRK